MSGHDGCRRPGRPPHPIRWCRLLTSCLRREIPQGADQLRVHRNLAGMKRPPGAACSHTGVRVHGEGEPGSDLHQYWWAILGLNQ
jgi:hypothetical protein